VGDLAERHLEPLPERHRPLPRPRDHAERPEQLPVATAYGPPAGIGSTMPALREIAQQG
jgi:hypothetical protein